MCCTLAKEEAYYGVRVNVVAPMLVDSPLGDRILSLKGITDKAALAMTLPWGRLLSVAEVAEAVASVGLDDAWQYATGHVFRLSAIV
jgi:NAD(P)-dependent dehydrogenase (short-subunit alcohol dehydrogenase family)